MEKSAPLVASKPTVCIGYTEPPPMRVSTFKRDGEWPNIIHLEPDVFEYVIENFTDEKDYQRSELSHRLYVSDQTLAILMLKYGYV